MPIEVESADRRRQIGEACLRVVRERGPAQLTIRAVAEVMGGSTSVVTHYVRNRRELLILAFTTIQQHWEKVDEEFAALPESEHFDRFLTWGVNWSSGENEVLAALFLELLTEARRAKDDAEFMHAVLDDWHRDLVQAAKHAGLPDSAAAADLAYLLSRGAMLSAIEHPSAWTVDRMAGVARTLAGLLRSAVPSDKGQP